MPNAAVRRQLCQEETEGYDANLTFDVNEYLIESWPKLTFKNRQSIWTIFQEDIDFNDIENQIDDYIKEHFPHLEKAVEEDDDDEDESVYDDLYDAIWYYVQDGWDGFEDEEVLDELVVKMIEWLDTCVDEYWDDDEDEDEDEDEDDTDETVDTQSETNDENTSVN